MAVKMQPVQDCPVCSMPAEYCEFSPDFENCKPWLIKNAPELYSQLVKEAAEKAADQMDGLTIGGEKDGVQGEGIKLSEASKKLGKKFASGASVVKGPTKKEQIDVQGDIMYDIVEFITDTWKSPVGFEQYENIRRMAEEIRTLAPDARVLTTYYCGPSNASMNLGGFESFVKLPTILRPHAQIFCTSEWVLGGREDLVKRITDEIQLNKNEEWWVKQSSTRIGIEGCEEHSSVQ